MSKVFEFFGDELVNKDGSSVKSKSILGEGKVVGIYFSAHWCPPCRKFTPKLAEFYEKVKGTPNGDKFEIVFVSSDREEESFKEYLSRMPWWALPFALRNEKGKLSRHFKVSGIPTLILLDGESGKVINKNGRAVVGAHPEGDNFPWRAKTLHAILKEEEEYITNNDEKKNFENDVKGKVLGIYFSAHWCPPCQAFTPKLCKVYDLVNKDEKKFEVIFVSSDQNESAFKEYFQTMPFLALPFDSEVKDELSEFYEVEGIPTLIIVDENGEVINTNGRGIISGDKEGQKFPWTPAPVEELDEAISPVINEEPCLIYLPGDDQESFQRMKEILKPLGEESRLLAKNEGRSPDLNFLVANPAGNDIVRSLCDFCRVNVNEKNLFILDIPSAKIYEAEKQEFTKEVVEQFVKDFRDEKLPGKNLRDLD